METEQELTTYLKKSGILRSENLVSAFQRIDRKDFVPAELAPYAYADQPLPIGFGQTISQPSTVVFMLECLRPKSGENILDIGSGSGWTSALLASIVGEQGRVYAVEKIKEIFDFGRKNLRKYNFKNLQCLNTSGWDGLQKYAPYDRILVSAAASALPEALKEQLSPRGRLVIPVVDLRNQILQNIVVIEKKSQSKFSKKSYPGFMFVPLVK